MHRLRAEPPAPANALAAEMFDHLCAAGTMKQILALHREICNTLNLKPNRLPDFYPILKAKLSCSWKAQALFKKFDARANHKVYAKGRACAGTRVLIIGAGPCGLRAAIECQLLGAKVVVVEKRDRMSRNNVLHLWPFVIQDLRALGAKKFLGKFCAGSIDHISIRQLQCILMKVSLLLGVEIHEGVSFEELLEPTVTENNETLGWRARVLPADHPVSQYQFDTLVGADGRRNTLAGFKRKEFRGKLAMAITANFINRHSEQEASVPEISGVAFIFNQKFFKDLYEETGIDLENIVYYKDDTHYFVMTAKKHSLLDKGVLLKDFSDVSRLLDVDNVDRAALMRYAQEAARFSTDGRLPLKDFALNHYGEPDVALFDFTSMYAAENASLVIERHNHRILCQLVGDSLLEPFWPTGSGCARGFLSALDAAWAVRAWGQSPQPHPLHVIAERESIYRLLAQTTPENLNRDFGGYTLEPGTRYRNLNRGAVTPHRVAGFYDSDEPQPLDAPDKPRKRRREAEVPDEVLLTWVGAPSLRQAAASGALSALLRRYRPDLLPPGSQQPQVYHALQHNFGIAPLSSTGSLREPSEAKVRAYLTRIYHALKGEVPHVHHETEHVFDQMKQNIQKEKHARTAPDQSLYMYATAVESDKSHSSYRKKRRGQRAPQVSNETEEYIRKKIGKLHLDEISQLARLIDGHDAVVDLHAHKEKQKSLQNEILALLDEDEAPSPKMIRETLAQLLKEPTTPKITQPKPKATQPEPKPRTKRHVEETKPQDLQKFFAETSSEQKPVKQQRKLKGLDLSSMNFPDLSDILDDIDVEPAVKPQRKLKGLDFDSMRFPDLSNLLDDVDLDTAVVPSPDISKKKEFNRSVSTDCRIATPVMKVPFGRSNSIGAPESVAGARRVAEIYESSKRRHSQSPKPKSVLGASTFERALKWQGMSEVQGRTRIPVPRMKRDSFGNLDMGVRRQKVSELIQGAKPQRSTSPDYVPRRRNSGEVAFKVQRHSDMMQKHKTNDKKKAGGRRKAAREIMKQRFDKSLQMLAAEPRLDFASSADLENDYGLQQYRASAPHFDERVKKLEKQLQHYEEGRIVAGGGRSAGGGGARVARLAAELAGTTQPSQAKSTKPKDLLRSVGKIEREDWNVKEIERKILENRLGRPEPKNAEKVPKWDREQFLGRQRRLKEGDNQEKWGQIDETLHKLDQKLRDSGRPDHGTKKVANLANKFVKQVEEPAKEKKEKEKEKEREETKKTWHGNAASGPACAACGARVFAAEGVTADGRRLHRACFRCALCAAALRPGNYTMERNGTRLVCLRHSGANIPDSGPPKTGAAAMTPERISLEASDHCAREIDEDEWTVSNFLASETSGAGGLSDEDESSSDEYTDVEESSAEAEAEAEAGPGAPRLSPVYLSDDSFGYDDYSDDGGSSSGAESCSRLRDALEARRREVPAEPRAPTDSSEVESDDDSSSSSSEEDVSSGTGVSTDSEFACEEPADSTPAPAITVTEAPPVPAPGHATPPIPAPATPPPLCRARSAGGLATKRALELKRKYLLGEASPPVVRRSDSTSQLDTKLETFRSNISEFQKMLNPAPPAPQPRPVIAFTLADRPPMPDIISNLCEDAPVDLLTKISDVNHEQEPQETEDEDAQSSSAVKGGDSDSSSDSPAPQSVPRLEVHDEGGDLIQLDSLVILSQQPEQPVLAEPQPESPVNAAPESEWSESCRDVSTLALTETDLSDWAAESAMLEDCATYDGKKAKSRSAPKTVHDAKNISAITSHVCGRTSPPKQLVDYANALEHFQFADEEDQDPSIATPPTPKNEGYMELVDDDEHPYSPVNDRSMNFIERSFSETIIAPHADTTRFRPHDEMANSTDSESTITRLERPTELKSPQLLVTIESSGSEKSIDNSTVNNVNENNSTSKMEEAKEVVSQASSSSKEAQAPSASEQKSEQTSEPVAEVTVAQRARSTSDHSERSEQSPPADRSVRSSEQCSRSTSDEFVRSTSEPHTRSPLKHTCKLSQSSSASPPLAATPDKSPLPMPIVFSTLKLYTPICRSASETFSRSPSHSLELSVSLNLSSGSVSPECARATTHKVQEIKREREEQTEVVRLLVLERLGGRGRRGGRPARQRAPPLPPPPVPPPPALPPPPLPVTPSFSDPELARETRKKNIIRSLSNYLNRRLGPRTKWVSEPDLSQNQEPRPAASRPPTAHKSCGGLEQAPPVPPPPASYYPPEPLREPPPRPSDAVERDAMQLWFEARWARLMSQRQDDRRLARLERRLRRPLSAEQQAAAVAELVQVSAQREAHEALMSADRRRCMTSGSACE